MPRRLRLPLILLVILAIQAAYVYFRKPAVPVQAPAGSSTASNMPADNGPVAAADTVCGDNLYQGAQPTLPSRLGQQVSMVCYQGYASASSAITRTPLWSAEHLTPQRVRLARATERANSFFPEPSLAPEARSELIDYRRSGFDRGHLAPSGDMPGHEEQRQSFSLANIAPQNSELNRGPWADLEGRLRDYVQRSGEVWVVTGVLFQGERINTTPDGRVMVPTSFWKAVMMPGRGAMVFVAANDNSGTITKVALADFTHGSGINPFPLAGRMDALEID